LNVVTAGLEMWSVHSALWRLTLYSSGFQFVSFRVYIPDSLWHVYTLLGTWNIHTGWHKVEPNGDTVAGFWIRGYLDAIIYTYYRNVER